MDPYESALGLPAVLVEVGNGAILMKVGDLVKPKHKYSRNKISLGLIVKVEDDFYRPRITDLYNATGNARLTILWAHGEQTKEPQNYVKVINNLDKQ